MSDLDGLADLIPRDDWLAHVPPEVRECFNVSAPSWRSAIADSALPPQARHVALTLSLHMNERGGGSCFLFPRTLRKETGLGRSSIVKYLRLLEQEGWLYRHHGGGKVMTRYMAISPSDRLLAAAFAKEARENGDVRSV